MLNFNIYEDIANRTGGDIYIGVVGPARTGKSTFIKKFMENLILPVLPEGYKREVLQAEMPQSASGKTVMTTEPKFVPSEAVKISVKENAFANVRLIDCVGFITEGAMGLTENDMPRTVKTPWSDELLPFEKAAELGTQKVISQHSTIAVLVTTDGSITDIARSGYVQAEEKAVKELKNAKKPFVILLNSTNPQAKDTQNLAQSIEEKYLAPVVALDLENANAEEIISLLEKVLFEFPISSFDICLPKWLQVLSADSKIISEVIDRVRKVAPSISKMKDVTLLNNAFENSEKLDENISIDIRLGEGRAILSVNAKEGVFYEVLSEECGEDIKDDYKLMGYVKSLSEGKQRYNLVKDAFEQAEQTGYGMVVPCDDDMTLQEPTLVKQGARCGVKLKATAPSYHILKVDVSGEVSPIVGTESQGEEVVKQMLKQFESNPAELWETNMFGKSLRSLVKEGLSAKLDGMPLVAQTKMRRVITKIVNEGKGGIICILL